MLSLNSSSMSPSLGSDIYTCMTSLSQLPPHFSHIGVSLIGILKLFIPFQHLLVRSSGLITVTVDFPSHNPKLFALGLVADFNISWPMRLFIVSGLIEHILNGGMGCFLARFQSCVYQEAEQ